MRVETLCTTSHRKKKIKKNVVYNVSPLKKKNPAAVITPGRIFLLRKQRIVIDN